ncbi:MAG: amidohydrolase family protein [Bacteroidota bacterium]
MMKPEKFLQRAESEIADNPLTRIPGTVNKIRNKANTIYDIHCHIFDKSTIVKSYFLLRILDKLDAEKKFDDILDHIIDVNKDNEFDELFKIMNMNSMQEILKHYYEHFAYQKNVICTPLMMDLEEGWYFKAKKSVNKQIDELKNLMNDYAILPFLAVDPRKAEKAGKNNLYQLFLKAFTPDNDGNQFYGIKIYPALGYLPSDKWLWPIYEICEKKKIPVTTHCGGTIIRTNRKDLNLKGYQIIDDEVVSLKLNFVENSGKKRAEFLNNPKLWEPVLRQFPKLKLNLGHFGGTEQWKQLAETSFNETIKTINRLMGYENVYADFSFNIAKDSCFDVFLDYLQNNYTVRNKSLYGTDYWMVLSAGDFKKNHKEFIKRLGEYKKLLLRQNPEKFLFE